jgi:hypothetical protein
LFFLLFYIYLTALKKGTLHFSFLLPGSLWIHGICLYSVCAVFFLLMGTLFSLIY